MIFFHWLFYEIQFPQFDKTALQIAIDKGYLNIVKILLSCPSININEESITKIILYLIQFQ